MIRRKRDTAASNVPSNVDLLESEGNLGIRKPGHSADYVPLVSPHSPQNFFQRISPTLRRTGGRNKHQYTAISVTPLGIEPSPFINSSNLISPGLSASPKPSPTSSTVDSDDEHLYGLPTAENNDLAEDRNLIDDHLFRTVATYNNNNADNEELLEHCSLTSFVPTTSEISHDRKGGVEFHMRNREISSSLPTKFREPIGMSVTPTKDTAQQTSYQTPPAKDESRRETAPSPIGSLRAFSLKSSPRDKPARNPATADGKHRRSSKASSIRIKEPRISLSGKKKFIAIHARDTVTDEPLIKVFLLLLQPKAKIFELIQIFFPPSVTTIGDIIHLIPANATKKALGSQQYIGLVRPRRRSKEYTNLSVMASGNSASMGITHGEILIAIPESCEGRYMIGISKQILSNPRIRTLLEKSASSLRVSTAMQEKGMPMTVVKEEPETPTATDVDHVLKRAQHFANESNSGPSASPNEFPSQFDYGVATEFSCNTPDDLYNFNGSYTDNLDDLSLQGSYSSWSRSFDTSLASVSRSALVPEPVVVKPRRQKKQVSVVVKVIGAVLLYLIIRFCLDSSVKAKTTPDSVMGVGGFLQFFLCFVSLVKMQRHKQRKAKKQPTRCPFIQHMKD
ncbi:hypothetical protein FisN_18Lh131 [Fistulifera solaris]|uniref:Uncharacterized protein n=1 Tax=Fistulifera solaris TaxID=1519565 RepID=A0A1Z5KEN8_FISSO|nr:hypothetical protein FisN_18Lh131 [Fistulifera solaris]|eukprot:GAX24790.1 hypothetical protein FisN_18Lh131 [Fistulifera solaris]